MFERRKQTGSDDVDLAGQTPEGRLFERGLFEVLLAIFGKEHEFMWIDYCTWKWAKTAMSSLEKLYKWQFSGT